MTGAAVLQRSVTVIGGGPAGLMAAEVLTQQGVKVDVYDGMPTVGRKFLLAGRGGLNLTHAESREEFVVRYGDRQVHVESWVRAFAPGDVREWVHALGVETFVGSSGRVFPVEMKASPLLRKWLQRLAGSGVNFHRRYRWNGTLSARASGRMVGARHSAQRSLLFAEFETPAGNKQVAADVVLLALGGGSWARLGSDGAWVPWLRQAGVQVAPLKPANCGFDVAWSAAFRDKYEGRPVKPVVVAFENFRQRGEFIVTKYGVQGSLVYAAAALLREKIAAGGQAVVQLDLAPDQTAAQLLERLSKPRGSRSMAGHLQRTVGMAGVQAGLLREFVPKAEFANAARLAVYIKQLPVPLIAPRPLDEAISSAGGVLFEALDEHLMLRGQPGVFCAGEMLDWEAPTGGYLLTACFASGRRAGLGALRWLDALPATSPGSPLPS